MDKVSASQYKSSIHSTIEELAGLLNQAWFSQEIQTYLETVAKIHQYSLYNQMIIHDLLTQASRRDPQPPPCTPAVKTPRRQNQRLAGVNKRTLNRTHDPRQPVLHSYPRQAVLYAKRHNSKTKTKDRIQNQGGYPDDAVFLIIL